MMYKARNQNSQSYISQNPTAQHCIILYCYVKQLYFSNDIIWYAFATIDISAIPYHFLYIHLPKV